MKLLIASDIHGDLESATLLISVFEKECCEKIVLLGDILYHGPRNDLPTTYNPKAVIKLLNENRDKILAVRGNCDTEVDQMVLDFPILADYAYLSLDGLSIFVTHGHRHNMESVPPLRNSEILLHGHTHIPTCEAFGDSNFYLNPGSVAIPKGGYPKSYMLYENKCFTIKDFQGNIILSKQF